MVTLGEKIKKLREDANLTQEALADMLYVSNKTISSWEVNRTMPDVNMLFKLSSLFKCNLYTLLDNNIYNNEPLEIEVKLKIDESDYKRIKKLLESKSDNIKEVKEIDTYYLTPLTKYNQECLRIRLEDNKYLLSYKCFDSENVRCEYESLIDNFSNLEEILYHLGCKKKGVIEKNRIKIMYKDKYEFSLDIVEGIGLFLEVEVKRIEYKKEEEIKKLFLLLKELNIDINKITTKKYNEYLEVI